MSRESAMSISSTSSVQSVASMRVQGGSLSSESSSDDEGGESSQSWSEMSVVSETHAQSVASLVEHIRTNAERWSFGDRLGVCFQFIGPRLFKYNNVVNRNGVRSRVEVRPLAAFFDKLLSALLQHPFAVVSLRGGARVQLLYCHSRLVRLPEHSRILLIGPSVLVKGHCNNYQPDHMVPVNFRRQGAMPKACSSQRLTLSGRGRCFDIRISSDRHQIFFRAEDVIFDRIRYVPPKGKKVKATDGHDDSDDEEGNDDEDGSSGSESGSDQWYSSRSRSVSSNPPGSTTTSPADNDTLDSEYDEDTDQVSPSPNEQNRTNQQRIRQRNGRIRHNQQQQQLQQMAPAQRLMALMELNDLQESPPPGTARPLQATRTVGTQMDFDQILAEAMNNQAKQQPPRDDRPHSA